MYCNGRARAFIPLHRDQRQTSLFLPFRGFSLIYKKQFKVRFKLLVKQESKGVSLGNVKTRCSHFQELLLLSFELKPFVSLDQIQEII